MTLIKWLLAVCIGSVVATAQAKDTTPVYFHAWGGSPQVNAYIQWVAAEVEQQYGIDLIHVKLSNTSEAVTQVLAQKATGDTQRLGNIDLIWLNGENFASMAEHQLLQPSWVDELSQFALTAPATNPDVSYDFGVPTQGKESPWGRASLVFFYNSEHISDPPTTLNQVLYWSQRNPGRFTYPHVDDFIGISFLKYALLSAGAADPAVDVRALFKPLVDGDFEAVTAPLWRFLDGLHPTMWRRGEYFVRDNGWLKRIFDDEEILLALSFSAGDIPASVQRFELPESTRTYTMKDGSLSNVHFVTIPFNAPHPQAAKTVANFLLSPMAQAEKNKPAIWGDGTVLDLGQLTETQRQWFAAGDLHPSALDMSKPITTLNEPHPSWITPLKTAWKQRYDKH